MKLEGRIYMCHGHNENDKNSGWENAFSLRLFFRFPRMPLASGRRRCAAQPVGRRGHTQFAILQSSLAIGFLCAAGNPSVSLRLPPPFHKGGLSYSPRPSGKLPVRPANHFRSWVQGTALVQGQCPAWSPSPLIGSEFFSPLHRTTWAVCVCPFPSR